MIITCPSCSTRYQVDPAKFGAERRVRCSSCSNVWTQKPADDLPLELEPPDLSTDALTSPDAAMAAGPGANMAAKIDAARAGGRPGRGRARAHRVHGSGGSRLGWGILVLVVIGVLVAGALARDTIVRAWPPSARLYAAIGFSAPKPGEGLKVRITGHSRIVEGNKTVLVIKGEIINASTSVRDVPRLRASLRDGAAKELAGWAFATAQTRLLPGERAPFVTRLDNPPSRANALNINFDAGGK